jgi:hypothetical protein
VHIFVISPPGPPTGGPEALHQLVHKAALLGHDAQVFYVPDVEGPVREAYRAYNTRRATQLLDTPDSVIVVPEILPQVLPRFEFARRMLWWLSVDNALQIESERKQINPDQSRFTLESTFAPEHRVEHLAQSEYARTYLAERGIAARMLTDYLSADFVGQARNRQASPKRDIVAFNPKKGFEFTQQLMAASAGRLDWVPIENMTPTEVGELLGSAKVYVDFGGHPGRDRIPREAALGGCVVITGTRGSAGNGIDVPIPGEFVIGEDTPDAVNRIVAVIEGAMSGFAAASAAFDSYRTWIAGHEDAFAAEVEAIFPRPTRSVAPNNRQERREAGRARSVRPTANGPKPTNATKGPQRKKSAHR